MGRRRVLFVTIVPSPYQRDLFAALAASEELDLDVAYLEAEAADSPWPKSPLWSFERVLPGMFLTLGSARMHINWPLPRVSDYDVVVVSGLTALSIQMLMRFNLRGRRWMFWGEKLRAGTDMRARARDVFASPLHRAAMIVGIGRDATADYGRRFPRTPTTSIPYYCNISAFLALPRHAHNHPIRFLFCGQMIRRKGVDVLLDAFAQLVGAGSDVELMLIGRRANLDEYLNGLSPEVLRRVQYEGFQAPGDLPAFFGRADVFVLPSRYDGWGVVINQALAAGLPVIASDGVGAARDLVTEGSNGFIVKAGNRSDLAAAMGRFIHAPQRLPSMSAAARQSADVLTPELGAQQWRHVLSEKMAEGVGARK